MPIREEAEAKTITKVDWSKLSDRAAWTVVNVEMPILFARKTYATVAADQGITVGRIRRLRQELQEELAAVTTRD